MLAAEWPYHAERSEATRHLSRETLRFAQGDSERKQRQHDRAVLLCAAKQLDTYRERGRTKILTKMCSTAICYMCLETF